MSSRHTYHLKTKRFLVGFVSAALALVTDLRLDRSPECMASSLQTKSVDPFKAPDRVVPPPRERTYEEQRAAVATFIIASR